MPDKTTRVPATLPPDEIRCRHLTPTGRRCRSSSAGSLIAGFCPRHSGEQEGHPADLAPTLIGNSDLQCAEGIHHSLSELYALLARDRVSPRRAAVLAYIGNLLLRTVSAIDEKSDAEKSAPVIIWDIAGPPREPQPHQESNGPAQPQREP